MVRIDPKKQFSKKLARWTAVFWFVYMTALLVLVYFVPDAALYILYLSIVVSVVMILNVLSYTRNSIIEKLSFAALDKAKIEVSLGGKGKQKQPEQTEPDEEGGDSNG